MRAQVYCLKALRAIEAGHGIDPTYRDYQPDDPAVKALLTRDISSAMKDPYKAAVEDCLIITMKVLLPAPGRPFVTELYCNILLYAAIKATLKSCYRACLLPACSIEHLGRPDC